MAWTSLWLAYLGGTPLFWLHAIRLGEPGPPIGHPTHLLLDSTLGLLVLAPLAVMIVPLVWRVVGRPGWDAAAGGALVGLATTPGPIVHRWLVGDGTPAADLVTWVFGADPAVAAAHAQMGTPTTPVLVCLAQSLVAVPLYALVAVFTDRWFRRGGSGPMARSQPSQ